MSPPVHAHPAVIRVVLMYHTLQFGPGYYLSSLICLCLLFGIRCVIAVDAVDALCLVQVIMYYSRF